MLNQCGAYSDSYNLAMFAHARTTIVHARDGSTMGTSLHPNRAYNAVALICDDLDLRHATRVPSGNVRQTASRCIPRIVYDPRVSVG